jgi:hypothetical protein
VKLLALSLTGLMTLLLLAPALALAPKAEAPQGVLANVPAEYAPFFEQATSACPEVPASVLAAQVEQESGWVSDAVSPAGAEGLGQFMPATWAAHGVDANGDGQANPFEPADALVSAALYDCYLLHVVKAVPGDPLELMLASYNAGPSTVLRHGGVPPFEETRRYVRDVLAAAYSYAGVVDSGAQGLTPRAAEVRRVVITLFGVTDIGGYATGGHVSGSDHYTGRAIDVMLTPLGRENTELGWRIALYLQSNAQRLGITYMIWQGRIWSVARAAEGWRPYRHPSGSVSPTLQHLDHVHVSVA